MTSDRPNARIVSATKEYLVTVGIEVLTLNVEVIERTMLNAFLAAEVTNVQAYLANYSVPVCLSVLSVGMAAVVNLVGHSASIVHHNRYGVASRSEPLLQVELLRGGYVV